MAFSKVKIYRPPNAWGRGTVMFLNDVKVAGLLDYSLDESVEGLTKLRLELIVEDLSIENSEYQEPVPPTEGRLAPGEPDTGEEI